MLCQKCNLKEANTYVKRIINGKVSEYHLCNECAEKMGYSNMMSTGFKDFSNLLGGLFGEPSNDSLMQIKRCPCCGNSISDIINSGKVGCAECYSVFKRELMPSIKKIHGNTVHCGKGSTVKSSDSKRNDTDLIIKDLKQKLADAVEKQQFELAAQLRDRINNLENKEDKNNG